LPKDALMSFLSPLLILDAFSKSRSLSIQALASVSH
jgi:hypothetical protein